MKIEDVPENTIIGFMHPQTEENRRGLAEAIHVEGSRIRVHVVYTDTIGQEEDVLFQWGYTVILLQA